MGPVGLQGSLFSTAAGLLRSQSALAASMTETGTTLSPAEQLQRAAHMQVDYELLRAVSVRRCLQLA